MRTKGARELDAIRRAALSASKMDGQDARVIDLLKDYLKSRPEDWLAWLKYGNALSEIGSKKSALNALRKALTFVPEKECYVAMGAVALWYDEFGSQKEAKKWLARATEGPKYLPGVWVMRGANLRDLGENQKALECFKKALRLNSEDKDEARLNIAGLRGTH
jgi:tetratricopeptide (TPR) repeat protein